MNERYEDLSLEVCQWCADIECDGIACIADLDPDDERDHEAIERLHLWLRLGRVAAGAVEGASRE